MEKRFELNRLYDIYGELLTEKRRNIVRLYLEEDLSLAEIGEETGISRQGVHEALLEAERKLLSYENALGILKREDEISEALRELKTVKAESGSREALDRAVSILTGR